MDEVHLNLEDTFVEIYTVDVKRNQVHLWCAIIWFEFEVDKYSYGRRSQIDFGLNEPIENWTNNGRGSIGATPKN